jgi:uncharacterized protein
MAEHAAGRGLAPLEIAECLRLLSSRYVGRLAFVQDGLPQVLPFNYALHDGVLVLRTGPSTLVDDMPRPVAFEVDEISVSDHRGWSVVVHGRAEEIVDPAELETVRALPLRPWAGGERDHYFRILSRAITGRRIG